MFVLYFHFHSYETTNGIKVRQTSYMIGNNRVVAGYYSYIGPDGKIYTTHYTADQYGYRARASNLPVQDGDVQPLPFVSSTPNSGPFGPSPSSPPFISSTPYRSSTPFYNDAPSPSPYRTPFNIGYSSTTPGPIVSPSTPFASVSPLSVPNRPHFPIYAERNIPYQGYTYTNPRINSPYSVVSQQSPAPVFFPSSTESPLYRYAASPSNQNSRVTTTFAPPELANDFNAISSTASPFRDDIPPRFKEYIPPAQIVSSTPRPFNSFSPNHPNTILITPKPSFNPPRLPNSLSINQNLLPPYLSVGPLLPQNIPRDNGGRFIGNPPFEYNDSIRPLPQNVAPLTVTDLDFRQKRNFKKN